MTRNQRPTATTGTPTYEGTPNRPPAAATPENSATVVPKLAITVARIARAVTLRLKFSRISAASPRPVTTPTRAFISCTMASTGVINTRIQIML